VWVYALQRIAQGCVVMLLITALTFFLVNSAPGLPASIANMNTTSQQREALSRLLRLDQPVFVRYLSWLSEISRGNLGYSLSGGEPVARLVGQRLVTTAQLALTALLISTVFGIGLGLASARYNGTWIDHLINGLSTLGQSIPDFWLGILGIILFAVTWKILPSSGMPEIGSRFSLGNWLSHTILPAGVLAFVVMPNLTRLTRSAILEVMQADYLRSARAKGLPEHIVVLKHAFRNALVPILAMIGLLIPALLSGSVVAESVFGWPGMGRLAVDAALQRDYTTVMGVTISVGLVVILTNLATDMLFSVIDPRIRHE
jgi:peptide/nickel transport system permease protein